MTTFLAHAALLLLLAILTACSRGEADAPGSPATHAGGQLGFYGATSGGL